mmetsp:Transcript_10865/g.12796  ORF Transcript_10865/g.12796 Transcript_10865/m.12796 type:complete len:205 (-) Transcript_10865:808-1422(-)|eukprot:CAMPEP_0197849414 /NCGR_PEP_ID=MMETSP1438-20131217/12000_1 /TAXON_ID=1461541 /ORGANISM="Pterosperma sp., Strain CCMP1384" /LENGTH=204 /DNA_ID=CAMNT_0043462091 /DNA_START=159 /DNA_END=773 /DNA_ORIENTATION=+
MGILGFNFDLDDQLSFYGSYHKNPWNQVIHIIFVPIILWTVACWLNYAPPIFTFPVPDALSGILVPNNSLYFLSIFALYYITLDLVFGLTWTLFLWTYCYLAATALSQYEYGWAIAIGLNLLSWYMQIHPGHMMLEKRRPALFDSLFQSLVLANLFVWVEVLFFLGYRKEYKAKLDKIIESRIEHMDKRVAEDTLTKPLNQQEQ